MKDRVVYPIPAELLRVPRDRSAVIEASAGTGKTFLIEHLVVDRVLSGAARLDEILVVTFTERAASELVRRIRGLIGRVLRQPAGESPAAGGAVWAIDAAARARLEAAERALDVASISTIHAFCQRVLVEHAFKGGRLLAQTQVESRTAFTLAFAETVRRRLSTDPVESQYLTPWLESGRSVGDLEELLYRASLTRAPWSHPFEPERLSAVAARFLELEAGPLAAIVHTAITHKGSAKSVVDRLFAVREAVARFVERRQAGRFLSELDALVKEKDVFSFVEAPQRLGGPAGSKPAVADLLGRLVDLAEAAPPLETVVAQRFASIVAERLRARKQAAGLYDFDDMLSLVGDVLAGPGGSALVETMRRRFRLAIIDEFQDTDPIQWEIFRTVFHDSGGTNPLYVIGDPKQAIYGFRGADVSTYGRACAEIDPGAERQRLVRNFRSTAAVIDAYNAILDQTAEPPFFSSPPGYDAPVVCGREDAAGMNGGARPIALLRLTTDEDITRLPMRIVRGGLAKAIAGQISRLLAGPTPPQPREIFVLTRTRRESEAVAAALAAEGVPHVLYNQEGLYETPEARQVRDLLRAVADPHDPEKRLRAFLTPFFSLTLHELPPRGLGGEIDPLVDRLLGWHAAASVESLGRLCDRILDESGVVRRELFSGESLRRLTNILHLFEVLSAEGARAPKPLGEVVRRLSALVGKLVVPSPEEGNVSRLEADRDAVQIMTMHKAKGLEADVVFVYGGFSPGPSGGIRTFVREGRRLTFAGRPRREETVTLVKAERDAEDQRLYYVALTRARQRLYLPFSGAAVEDDGAPLDRYAGEELWRLTGGYRHVNRRLRALASGERARELFETIDVPVSTRAADDDPGAGAIDLGEWSPEPEQVADVPPDPAFGRLRRTRRGAAMTSYSRIKQAHGGYRPPTQISDELPALTEQPEGEPEDDALPGGARTGIFLHALLEEVPLSTLLETPRLEDWAGRAEIRALLESTGRRYGRDPRQLSAAARIAHAALTAPLPVRGGTLGGLAAAARVAREMEFLFPFPESAGGADRGFVKGYVDVIFEHAGRSYFADWKTDRLPGWDPELVRAHVAANYALQEKLYALALVKMLGIADEAGYEAQFGGTLYVFVRGLPAAIQSRRPSYGEIQAWEAELATALESGEEGSP